MSLWNMITSKWRSLHLNQTLDESHPTWLSKITLFQPDQLHQQMWWQPNNQVPTEGQFNFTSLKVQKKIGNQTRNKFTHTDIIFAASDQAWSTLQSWGCDSSIISCELLPAPSVMANNPGCSKRKQPNMVSQNNSICFEFQSVSRDRIQTDGTWCQKNLLSRSFFHRIVELT